MNAHPKTENASSVSIPKIDTDQPIADILSDVVTRLDQVASVMSREVSWLRPKVERTRAEEAADVAAGLQDPDLYDGSDVTLVLDNTELDTHLANIEAAALIAADAAFAMQCGRGRGLRPINPNLTITQAMLEHRAAVLIDEQSYDNDCNAILQSLAEATGKVEAEAFITLAKAPCADDAEVQVKLSYFLNEQIGERSLPVDCLGHEEYGGFEVFEQFIRSLLLQETGR